MSTVIHVTVLFWETKVKFVLGNKSKVRFGKQMVAETVDIMFLLTNVVGLNKSQICKFPRWLASAELWSEKVNDCFILGCLFPHLNVVYDSNFKALMKK